MKRHLYLSSIAVLLVFLVVPAASAQVSDAYVITAAASQPGAGSTNWLTRLSIFNPQSYALRISIVHVPPGVGTAREVTVVASSNETLNIDDPLRTLFNLASPASGGLIVSTFTEENPGVPDNLIDRAFLVTSQTFNNLSSGTYGQTIEGTTAGLLHFDYDKISAISAGVRNVGVLGLSGFRSNIGAVNLGGKSGARLLVTVREPGGRIIADKLPFVLPPMGWMQDRLPIAVDGGSVEFFVDDPNWNDQQNYAVVFPYVSMADNRTGDPTYLRPVLLAAQSVVYPKAAASMDLGSIGKKIDSDLARRVRDRAEYMGTVSVK